MFAETQYIKFKPSFNEEIIETVTAFSNTKGGGRILVSVDDNGHPVKGFVTGKESIPRWLNEIQTKTQPSIIPDIDVIQYCGNEVVEISVQEFPIKPVAFRGRISGESKTQIIN
jgi:ATP-dependent DNA helicase RecG